MENTHEAIIGRETFDYVQREMARRRSLGPLANKALNITCFTGKIKCGKCGRSFHRSTQKNRWEYPVRGDVIVSWACSTRKNAKGHCSMKEIPECCLRRACAEAMGMDDFDEEAFNSQVDFIRVPENGILVFHFKDGKERSAAWKSTAKKDCWTADRKALLGEYRRSGGRKGTGRGFNEYIEWKEASGKCQKP